MLMISILAINFLNKAICIKLSKPFFLNFTDDIRICYPNSILKLNLPFARHFQNKSFMATKCKIKKIVGSYSFSAQLFIIIFSL